MKTNIRKSLALFLTLTLLLAQFLIPLPVEAATTDIQDGVTLHCWNWSFKNIEANMAKIAEAGYTAIQTSPIQQAKQKTAGSQTYDWWVYYQPASFSIDNTGNSALGNKADFKRMCKAADKYGIKVIVDVVANHMGDNGGNNISPSVIPDIRNDSSCWHDIKTNISNYSDRYNITQYCMDGLPDLNTSNKKVQNYVLNFLKECVDAGADGFRFDAAKHIETPDDPWCKSDFWPTVINGIKSYDPDVYFYGELLFTPDDGGRLPVSAYTKYMSVTDNSWSNTLRNNVIGGKNAGAFHYAYHKNVNADKLVLWAESHDTYAGEGSNKMPTADINKTWALAAARADAMGLYLARPNSWTQSLGTASTGTGWANKEVAAVNKFHTAFAGQSEYVSNQSGIAYVERGNSGVVLVNCSGTTKQITVDAHVMKDGTYTDAISGSTFTVKNGKISGKIGSTGIAVVYKANHCAHKSHNKNGICSSCGMDVGHNYNSSGKCACGAEKPKGNTLYFTNSENWSTVNIYTWTEDGSVTEYAGSWPGSAMTKVEGNLYSYTLPTGAKNVIFNNGSDQTADLTIPTGKNHYTFASGAWSSYVDETEPDPEPEPKPEPKPEPEICIHALHDANGLCTNCGETVGHNYKAGICSVCGTADPTTPDDPDAPEDPEEPEIPDQPEIAPTEETTPSASETEPDSTQPTKSDDPVEIKPGKDPSAVIWIVLGCVLALGATAAVIVVILKKKK